MVVIDKLTKIVHIILVRATYEVVVVVWLFIKEIVWLDGVPLKIISNRDCLFMFNFGLNWVKIAWNIE